jgi:hypothetical protein
LRDRVDEERLREPRHADDEAVPAGEKRGEHLLDHGFLPDDPLAELGDDVIAAMLQTRGKVDVRGCRELWRLERRHEIRAIIASSHK